MPDPRELPVLSLLDELGIAWQRYEHPAVRTVDEANQYWRGLSGVHAKNLFLRNAKGNAYYLVVMDETRPADLKALAGLCGEAKLSFASEERLLAVLGLERGAVSPFGLINDTASRVCVLLDRSLAAHEFIPFHPNVNTATINVRYADFERFLAHCGNRILRF